MSPQQQSSEQAAKPVPRRPRLGDLGHGLLALSCLVLFCWPGRLDNPDALARVSVTEALARAGTVEVSLFRVGKMKHWYIFADNGKIYSNYLFLHSLLMVPGYWLAGERGASLVNPVLNIVLALVLFSTFRRLKVPQRRAVWAMLIVCSTTMLLPYAGLSHDGFIQAVLLAGMVRLLLPGPDPERRLPLVGAGLLFGLGINTQLAFFFTLPAALALLLRPNIGPGVPLLRWPRALLDAALDRRFWARLAWFCLALTPLIIGMVSYNVLRWGQGKYLGSNAGNFVKNQVGLGNLGAGLFGLLFSPSKSVFLYNPSLVLSLPMLPRLYRRAPLLTVTLLGTVAVFLFGIGHVSYWHGDWSWGPRYLVPLLPLVMLPVAELLRPSVWVGIKRPAKTLLLISLFVQLVPMTIDPYRFFHERALPWDFHMEPGVNKRYFSTDFMPLVDAVAGIPAVTSRMVDGLFYGYRGTKGEVQRLTRDFHRATSEKERMVLAWRIRRLQAQENLNYDFWWLHDLLHARPSKPAAVIVPPLLALGMVVGIVGLLRGRRRAGP